ncbi:MAG: hypothetical protein EX258_05335 [Sphingomonadaceae bacterium]|nr:MAG: hypothetical protein EX258_05335 [Sphingomonadaceae bacterium]
MMKVALSPVATGLLRVLIARADAHRDRICLMDCRSVDWQSLTFIGERHELSLRILGPHADAIASRLLDGLEEAEFSLRGHIVADIARASAPLACSDGSIEIRLEALTLVDA